MNDVNWGELIASDERLRRRLSLETQSERDIVSLVRSALGASGATGLHTQGSPIADVSNEDLSEHGLVKASDTIRARPWYPTWLESGRYAVGEATARRTPRQTPRAVEGDPFYTSLLGRKNYRTDGQRLAVRSVVSAGPGDVLTCVLPTGSGKTDVFLLQALRARPRQTLVIVPTVSLALDLERRVQEMLGTSARFAYSGTLAADEKLKFRARIASGEQWLTFTSPEAACTALSKGLEQAATAGRLGLFVIDEAHIVAEWGDDFRLEYQTLAALRRRLEEMSPAGRAPTTLLLTGTLDQRGYETLQRLFPGRQDVLVSDQSTRPEPEWWSAKCDSEDAKRTRLLEAVAHLPRPLLIYTSLHTSPRSTTVADVRRWLTEAGYEALQAVAGNVSRRTHTAAVAGLRLSSSEKCEDLDIVVATSAFGMGVDIDDIRAVIHVCIPESVNRLYQEVGRAGRDGKAATALVLWTEADMEVAAALSQAKQISEELAWTRWERMRLGVARGHRVTVDLTTAHPRVNYPFSDANRYWNMQTLLGMQRAEMVRIEWPDPPPVGDDVDDDDLADAFQKQWSQIDVEVLQSDLDEKTFLKRFRDARRQVKAAGNASYASALELLGEHDSTGRASCINDRLAAHYSFVDRLVGLVPVEVQCGGCPPCRRSVRRHQRLARVPYASGIFNCTPIGLEALFKGEKMVCIRRDSRDSESAEAFLRRLTERRVIRFLGATPMGDELPLVSPSAVAWWESVDQFTRRESDPTDVLSLVDADEIRDDVKLLLILNRLESANYSIVVTSSDRIDPSDQRFLLSERYVTTWSFEHALGKI